MQHNYFNLTKEIALSDFKLRYHGSVLGVLWSFLKPLLMFGVLLLVFTIFVRFEIKNYVLYLLLGLILWNFFSEATTLSITLLEKKAPLIKKVAFPRDIIIISSTFTSLLSFLFNIVVFCIFFVISDIQITFNILFILPYITLLYFLALGTSFLISALYVKFRDIKHIWEIMLQLGFWVTPIIYSVDMVPERFHFFLYLNPMTRVIQYSREAVLQGRVSNLDGIFALFFMTLVIFAFGLYVYRKKSPYFAEEL